MTLNNFPKLPKIPFMEITIKKRIINYWLVILMEQKLIEKNPELEEAKRLYYNVQDIIPVALVFVTLAILLGAGAYILVTYNDSLTGNAAAQALVGQGVDNLTTISTQTGTLIVVIMAVIILSIVVGVLAFRQLR